MNATSRVSYSRKRIGTERKAIPLSTHELPSAYYAHDMEGRRIPHSVNPGPQRACARCELLRCGADFCMTSTGPVCRYCVAATDDWYESPPSDWNGWQPPCGGKGESMSDERTVIPVNPQDADWTDQRFVLWFGEISPVQLLIWGKSLEDCLDEGLDWVEENAPGLLCDTEVAEEYERLIAEGKSEDYAIAESEVDTTSGGNHGVRINSDHWGISLDNPSRGELLAFMGRVEDPRTVDQCAPLDEHAWIADVVGGLKSHGSTAARYAQHRASGMTASAAYYYATHPVR